MIRQLRQNWIILLLAAVLTIVGNMVFSSWVNRTDSIRDAASIDYVDRENDKQDIDIKDINVRMKLKAEKTEVESVHEDVREIRNKTDKIYELLINMKDE